MPRGLRGRTLPPTGIEKRLKALRPTVTELSDSEMVTFLRELADRFRSDAIREYDPLVQQGLVNEAASLDIVVERLIDLIDYLDQGTLKRELGEE